MPAVPGATAAAAGQSEEDIRTALAFVLRSTSRRPQTEAEIRDRLRTREIPPEAAEAALRRARALGAVDDAAFARAWVGDRGELRGFGAARLRAELRRRQVPEPLIDDALAALQGRDEYSTAVELARSRAQRLPPRLEAHVVARRLTSYLVRRGYAPALAQRAAATVSGLDRSWD